MAQPQLQTKTDRALAASELALAASDPERAELIARVRRFKAGWYELAEALTEQKRSERYKAWGYKDFEDYFKREVLPHVPDAWIDQSKTKIGYEIPLNRHFYRYEPPRPLEVIEDDIKTLERDILDLLKEVTA